MPLMSSRALINSLSLPSTYADFFAADARELYRHANEPIFLLLIIGGEGILMHDDDRDVTRTVCPRKVWEHLFDRNPRCPTPQTRMALARSLP